MHKRAVRKSCLIKATEWAAVENIQPENCSRVPVDSVPELRGCSPELSLSWGFRTRLNFSAQRWAGKRGWVAWWWCSSLYLSWWCVSVHPEVGSETPAANRLHKVCLLPPGCLYLPVCVCKKHPWRKSKGQTNIQSWPWTFVAGRWEQNSSQQRCSGWPMEFCF